MRGERSRARDQPESGDGLGPRIPSGRPQRPRRDERSRTRRAKRASVRNGKVSASASVVFNRRDDSAQPACQHQEQVAAASRQLRGGTPAAEPEGQGIPSQEEQKIARWRRPKYVESCAHNPDPDKPTAVFYVYDPKNPLLGFQRGRAFCKSWRCEWGCADHESHIMFSRIEEAFAPYEAEDMVFMVLTLDSPLHALGLVNLDGVFWELRERFEWFRKRLRRWLDSHEMDDFETRWCAVIEQHESGIPHVNVVFHAPRFARHLKTRCDTQRARGRSKRNARLLAGLEHDRNDEELQFADMLHDCGFGFSSTAEQVCSKGAVMGYLTQVAKHAGQTLIEFAESLSNPGKKKRKPRRRRGGTTGVAGEVAKTSQLPVAAPKGFRRLRSGVHFLPPRRKGNKTGSILHHSTTQDGYEHVASMVDSKRPLLAEMIAIAIDLERDRVWAMRNAEQQTMTALATKIGVLDQEIDSLKRNAREFTVRPGESETQRKIAEGSQRLVARRLKNAYAERSKLRREQRRELGKVPIGSKYLERLEAARLREVVVVVAELHALYEEEARAATRRRKRISRTRAEKIEKLRSWLESQPKPEPEPEPAAPKPPAEQRGFGW